MYAFFGANTQVAILNELLATRRMKGGSFAWRPSPPSSLTAPQKQDQPGTPDQSENHTNQCSFSSRVYGKQIFFSKISGVLSSPLPLASASRTVGVQKNAHTGPSGRTVKGPPEFGPPPWFSSARSAAVFLRKIRPKMFFQLRIQGGRARSKSPWNPQNVHTKPEKKKLKAGPKCGLPPWFSCARSAAEFPRTMRRNFFFEF